ncbi:uncharacterized protein LOC122293193 isoform X1 [Carya illinoinensis]|uniref:uncharacterized protein LOC122293193 isoform X1 n=2 Tax=Carya illinoinensis TaxID=32201 RepID=UPI001C7201A2|nr:uncharacterized protein LOC122293193 isoform X1 [Carya illinoinensis]
MEGPLYHASSIRNSSIRSDWLSLAVWLQRKLEVGMGNRPVKQQKREEVLLKIVPPLDPAYARWLARDIERMHGYTPRNPRAVKPPEHYIEYMRLNGWLDVDLDDPDLAHLFK